MPTSFDRVLSTTTTTGTGTITLNGALNASYQAFSLVGNGNTCVYEITDNATFFEIGLGTYSSTGPTLTRSTIYASSNSGAAVNLPTGTAFVSLVFCSSQINQIFASGSVTSGQLGIAAVNNLNITSGTVTGDKLASGTISQNLLASGVGGSTFSLTSGIITSGLVGNGAINSGNLASGSVGLFAMASGFNGWSGGGASLSSGIITSGYVGNGAINSGNIASGSIGQFALASGAVNSGQIASGAVGLNQLASGITFPQQNTVYCPTLYTACETIASGSPLSLNQSSLLQAAMSSVSGRMPAFAVTQNSISSGANVNPPIIGKIYQGAAAYSGNVGQPVYVGRSGGIVWASGGLNSGGFQSGDLLQTLGIADSVSGAQCNVVPVVFGSRASGL